VESATARAEAGHGKNKKGLTMDLAEFVRESLCEIEEGVRTANDKISEGKPERRTYFQMTHSVSGKMYMVDFDVAVTTKAAGAVSASGGGKLLVVSADLNVQGEFDRTQASRVRFSVGVNFALT
jgi:hypothetical protein